MKTIIFAGTGRIAVALVLVIGILAPAAQSQASNSNSDVLAVEEVTALVSWAAMLSTYPAPERLPELRFVPHGFFVERACGGEECNVIGWYNDEHIVYIDVRLRAQNTLFARSLMVHEVIHYLQHISGEFDTRSCGDSVAREREAYEVQRQYIMAHGSMAYLQTHHRRCS